MEFKHESAAVLLAAVTVTAAPAAMQKFQSGLSGDTSSVKWDNEITVYKNGDQVDQIHNTLTEQGQKFIAAKLFDDTDDGTGVKFTDGNATFIGLANATNSGSPPDFTGVSPENVSLTNEIDASVASGSAFNLSRNESSSITSPSVGKIKLRESFTSNTTENIVVAGTGLYFNSTGPSLVSGGAFTGATLKSGDTITVTHEITISDGGN